MAIVKTTKRLKLSSDPKDVNRNPNLNRHTKRTSLFSPYRKLGLVTTGVPFTITSLGTKTFQITTSIGSSFQTYDLKRGLQLIFISTRLPGEITSLCSIDNKILVAWSKENDLKENDSERNVPLENDLRDQGLRELYMTNQDSDEQDLKIQDVYEKTLNNTGSLTGLWLFQRGKKIFELECPDSLKSINSIITFGSWLIGLCSLNNQIEIWKDYRHYTTIYTESTCITTMPTFLNKIFIGKSNGSVEIWNIKTGRLIYTILSNTDEGFVSCLEPTTCLNLISIGFESGMIKIYDIKNDQELLDFKGDSIISSISFRKDELGSGEDGRLDGIFSTSSNESSNIMFWDLNQLKRLNTLRYAHEPLTVSNDNEYKENKGNKNNYIKQKMIGGISKIQFLPGQSILVSNGFDNTLKSWIFDQQPFSSLPRLLHIRSGHSSDVIKLHFISTLSNDTDLEGKWLLSSSKDRKLNLWSLRKDSQNVEMSQGGLRKASKNNNFHDNSLLENLKVSPIISISTSLNRDNGLNTLPGKNSIWSNLKTQSNDSNNYLTGWESIITAHESDKFARTWIFGKRIAGRWKFSTSDNTNVSKVLITKCGTFGVIGSFGGMIDIFNLQSGLHRLSILNNQSFKKQKRNQNQNQNQNQHQNQHEDKHNHRITGLIVDNLNRSLISTSYDGKIKFWDFQKGILKHEIDWSFTFIKDVKLYHSNNLLGLLCNDECIRLIDIETKKLVREFKVVKIQRGSEASSGLRGSKESKGLGELEESKELKVSQESKDHFDTDPVKLIDFTFSNDGLWVIIISNDSCLRVFDISTGNLIEFIKFENQPLSLEFSPTGEYLITSHLNQNGISLWKNLTLYRYLPIRKLSFNDYIEIDKDILNESQNSLRLIKDANDGLNNGSNDGLNDLQHVQNDSQSSLDQISQDLLTLSLIPKSKLHTLLNLEIIRKRNKPIEPLKKMNSVPFFLPNMEENDSFVKSIKYNTQDGKDFNDSYTSKVMTLKNPETLSNTRITQLLKDYQFGGDTLIIMNYLSSLGASEIDLLISTLDSSYPYNELVLFINVLTERLRLRKDFELIQTWMRLFLRYHEDVIIQSNEIKGQLKLWKEESFKESKRLSHHVGYVKGIMNYIGSVI